MTTTHRRPRGHDRRRTLRRTWPIPAIFLGLVLAVACSGPDFGGDPGSDSGVVPEPVVPSDLVVVEPSEDGDAPGSPEIVSWGGNGDQLAVVVRNQSAQQVRQAGVLIEVLDADGVRLFSTRGSEGSTCCTVLSLPPGGEYGLFAELGFPVSDVADVRVSYIDPVMEPAVPATLTITSLDLQHTVDDTEVRARVEAVAETGPYIVGQAFLVDEQDALVGVISGRFYCFTAGLQRELRMELLRPTPPSTRVSRVVAYPVPEGAPTGVAHTCH